MKARESSRFDPAGDVPLVLFTSLGMMGAGIMGALPLTWIVAGAISWPDRVTVLVSLTLLAGGLLISLLHLGRKNRMPLAAAGVLHSLLSMEVVLAAALLASLSGVLIAGPAIASIAQPAAAALSLLFLLAIGKVYHLEGQLTWQGAAISAPLILGLLWGVLFHFSDGLAPVEGMSSLVYLLIVLDIIVTESRWKTIERMRSFGTTRNPLAITRRRSHLMVRIATVDLLGAGCFLLNIPTIALICVAAGIVSDRYSFYALGIQRTTEAEVERIETIIREGRGG